MFVCAFVCVYLATIGVGGGGSGLRSRTVWTLWAFILELCLVFALFLVSLSCDSCVKEEEGIH